MKLRKTIEVDIKVETPPKFKATRKYRLAFAISILRDRYKDEIGMAVGYEKVSGRAHLITHGLHLTKYEIISNPEFRGKRFLCVGQRVELTKTVPIYEMILDKPIWEIEK